MNKETYPVIHVGPDENGQTIVKADGKLLGPADKLVEFVIQGAIEAERAKAPLPAWIEAAKHAFQSTR